MDGDTSGVHGWAMFALFVAILLPAFAPFYTGCMAIFKAPTPSRATMITMMVLEILFIAAAVVLFNLTR